MKAFVDRDKCAGIGMCEATAPNLFEVSDDGQAIVLTDEIAGEDRAAAREAVDNCPAGALTITE